MIIVIREQCLKLIWAVIIRCLGSSGKYLTDDEQMKPPTFIFGWLQHPSEGELSDPANRTSYQSCLQNSMSIISFVIDFQVEHLKHNINTTNNPFASKLLIKVYIDFLLENAIDIKTSIYLRCLKSLAKITPGLSILLESSRDRFRAFITQNIKDRKSSDITMAILDFFDCINDFWKNNSTPISNTNIRIELMDTGDKRAVAASFRLLTKHLLNYKTLVKLFFQSNIEKDVLNEQSLSFSSFSAVIYFTKTLLCLNVNVDQQQYDLARHSNIATNLLDFVDYCNDIHPTTKDISRI
ncbi:unnamed protein product [Rotaria magnacalcarata]|uniref:Uncharacterized protein n=1 Tax=Rotaria magnacalcarata TaxID=392030 RepID=A0A8S2J4N0_9BILA|nr:unnamed protein product [Rotaria magnacalcarata]